MSPDSKCDPCFPPTRWTLISRLRSDDEAISRPALAELCSLYQFPLYCYIRRRGFDHHDAEDALQDFFAKLLRLDSLSAADPDKGRLRSYLSTALHRFLIDWRKKDNASRSKAWLPPCERLGELRLRYEREVGGSADSPEVILDRRWAHVLMALALAKLRESQVGRGKERVFDAMLPVLVAGGRLARGQSATLAAELGMTEGAVRVALSRLLRDYRDALESVVLETVTTREQIAEEISYLLSLFARP
jgi:RNA polymerase sigma-70 factor (ECF subfamily)